MDIRFSSAQKLVTAIAFAVEAASFSGYAHAQLADETTRAAARGLANEGEGFFREGNYDQAIDRFSRAFDLVKAPTIAMRHAESLVRLGRLVEARERYLVISRTNLPEDAPDVFKDAVGAAAAQADALQNRIGNLELSIKGEDLEGAQLVIDGKTIPAVLWSVMWPVNPGVHHVVLAKGNRKTEQSITIEEGRALIMSLLLPASVPSGDMKLTPTAINHERPASLQPPPVGAADHANDSQTMRTLGWVGFGVGGAGLLVGGIAGGIALSKHDSLSQACPDAHCPSSYGSEVDRYRTVRTVSTGGFVVGVVGAGAGLTLILTSLARNASQSNARISPWIGVGSAGLVGKF
jgi:hypothetical protein